MKQKWKIRWEGDGKWRMGIRTKSCTSRHKVAAVSKHLPGISKEYNNGLRVHLPIGHVIQYQIWVHMPTFDYIDTIFLITHRSLVQ